MGLISKLFSRKPAGRGKSEAKAQEPVADFRDVAEKQIAAATSLDDAMMSTVTSKALQMEATSISEEAVAPASKQEDASASSVNIWDMNDDDAAGDAPKPSAAPEAASAEKMQRPRRRARNKTRILGFEPQDAAASAPGQAEPKIVRSAMTMNATGWLIVVDGPGRGASFPLYSGMASIGRGTDQVIALDFGDTSISRDNHASIVYDPADHVFYFGHGGKSNLVRMNGKPVLSTETTKDGDEYLIGETTLRLKTLCGPDFNWETTSEGDDDVAIA